MNQFLNYPDWEADACLMQSKVFKYGIGVEKIMMKLKII